MWDLPGPEIKTMSPTLAGGFFNTVTMEALLLLFFNLIGLFPMWLDSVLIFFFDIFVL